MIALVALLLAGQTPATPLPADRSGDTPTRFSILTDPCARSAIGPTGNDIIVCGKTLDSPRLPLPDEAGPRAGPLPVNPYMRGKEALAAASPPCSAVQRGCQVGVDFLGAGTSIVRLAQKLVSPDSCCERPGEGTSAPMLVGDMVSGVKKMFRKKPDKRNRVAIPLDDPAPVSATVPTAAPPASPQ